MKENPRRDLIYQISVEEDVINHIPTKAKNIAAVLIDISFDRGLQESRRGKTILATVEKKNNNTRGTHGRTKARSTTHHR